MTMTMQPCVEHAQNGKVPDDDPAAKPAAPVHRRVQARSWRSTRARPTPGPRGRCCAVRASTRARSSSGDGPRKPVRSRDRLPSTARSGPRPSGSSRGCAGATPSSRPSWPSTAGPRDPGKSIGALGPAAGREHCGDDQQTEEASVIDECFAGRAAARHQGGLRGRRPVPGHPLPTPETRPGHRAKPRPAPPNKLGDDRGRRHPRGAALAPVRRLPRRPRCTSPCSTRAPIWPRSRPSTGSCGPTARSVSAAARPPTRPGSSPSSSPTGRWSCGAGTSPS